MVNVSLYFWGTYIMFAIVFGIIGKQTKLGFWGTFLISLFLTPAVGMLVVISSKPKDRAVK